MEEELQDFYRRYPVANLHLLHSAMLSMLRCWVLVICCHGVLLLLSEFSIWKEKRRTYTSGKVLRLAALSYGPGWKDRILLFSKRMKLRAYLLMKTGIRPSATPLPHTSNPLATVMDP